jgi:hypothetical protein
MTKWANGITAIRHADLGPSPASVNRETGVMYVNPNFRDSSGQKLTRDQWYWIMLHEMGHLAAQTKDELTADDWADKHYKGSLKESVYVLTDVLPFNKAEDRQRVVRQLQRTQKRDGKEVKHYAFTGTPQKQTMMFSANYGYYFTGKQEQMNFVPVIAIAEILPKAAPVIAKAVASLKGVIKKDDALITLRDNFLSAFKQYGITEAQWSPYIAKYKIAHSDIPNVKILGNYEAETKRVLDFSVEVMTVFFAQKVNGYIAWMSATTDPIVAVKNALAGLPIPGTAAPAAPAPAPAAPAPARAATTNTGNSLQASLDSMQTPQKVMVFGGIALLIIAVVLTMLK